MRKAILIAGLFTLTMQVATTMADDKWIDIKRSQFGDKWPLTVDAATLGALNIRKVGNVTVVDIVAKVGDDIYAINGTARGTKKYKDGDLIWADDSSIPGMKKNIGPIIDRGLELAGLK